MKAKYTQVNFTTLHHSCSNEWAKPKAHSKYSKLDQTHTQKYTISPQLQPIHRIYSGQLIYSMNKYKEQGQSNGPYTTYVLKKPLRGD